MNEENESQEESRKRRRNGERNVQCPRQHVSHYKGEGEETETERSCVGEGRLGEGEGKGRKCGRNEISRLMQCELCSKSVGCLSQGEIKMSETRERPRKCNQGAEA